MGPRAVLLVAALVGSGCSGEPARDERRAPSAAAPVGSGTPATAAVATAAVATAAETVAWDGFTFLVPLDADEGLDLPPAVVERIAAARAKLPARLDPRQAFALRELEAVYERLEAALEGADEGAPVDRAAYGELLADFFWERLRLFDPALEAGAPPELGVGLQGARRD